MSPDRPPHLQWGNLALVVAGGAAGTAGRGAVEASFPAAGPWAILAINVVGSLLLGILVAWVARPGAGLASRAARLAVGTGALGGFTTYSTFALDVVRLGPTPAAVGYAVGSVVLGALAAGAGLALGHQLAQRT